MLRIVRMLLATVAILAITLLFVDFTGIAARWLSFLPKIQLVPALLALNLGALCLLAVLTLVFGRVYCSVICPLGIYQDIVMRLRIWLSPKRKRRAGFFRHSPEAKKLRYGFFAMFLVLVALGLAGVIASSFAGLLDPYSAYGRMASRFALPLWRTAVVPVADMAAESGVYVLDSYPAAQPLNVAVLAVAVLTFVVVTAMAWRGGRDYCNKVCPAGTMLGLLSRFSLLKPAIDTDKCNRCGTCGRKCKASCIDTNNHSIDYSRCVVCMDCIGNCTRGAISYARRRGGTAKAAPDATRRSFMVGLAVAGGAIAARAADKATDGGLAPLKDKQRHPDAAPAVPAGAIGIGHLSSRCTACQLCVSACPEGVLRPSLSASRFMQPELVFTGGFCRPDCTECSHVCPAGAIKPVDAAEKTAIRIGRAVVGTATCISAAYGQHCGNCARHCPAGAIQMVKGPNGNMRPSVDESVCIGCGSCEYHCPVGTAGHISSDKAAIYVEGYKVHLKS